MPISDFIKPFLTKNTQSFSPSSFFPEGFFSPSQKDVIGIYKKESEAGKALESAQELGKEIKEKVGKIVATAEKIPKTTFDIFEGISQVAGGALAGTLKPGPEDKTIGDVLRKQPLLFEEVKRRIEETPLGAIPGVAIAGGLIAEILLPPYFGKGAIFAKKLALARGTAVKTLLKQGIKDITEEEAEILAIKLSPIKDAKIIQSELDAFATSKGVIPDLAIAKTGKEVLPETQQPLLKSQLSPEVPTYIESIATQAAKSRERGFIQSVKESPQIPGKTKELIESLPEDARYYDVFTDSSAVAKAEARIARNREESLSYVLTAEKADKEVITTGIDLMRIYRNQGNFEMEARIAGHLAQKGTEAGQVAQAFSILNKLSPEGILVHASKRIGQPLSPQLTEKITRQAEKIQELPFGYAKYKETQNLAEIISREVPRSLGSKTHDWLAELANVPKTMMSSFLDLSFALKQGIVALFRHPKDFAAAFKSQFKPFVAEKNYDLLMDSIMRNPDFPLASQSGMAFTDINAKLGLREERFMSSLAEKIPIIGGIVRATNRAYTAMANKMRMDLFSTQLKLAEDLGLNPKTNEKLLREIASEIGDWTGRGDLPKLLEKGSPMLNAFFFSPRLIASRLNMLVPIKYITAEPFIRKQYLRTMLSFSAGMTTILGAAHVAGLEVGIDPRSADFGKIKIGNTRIDIMGGFQQYLRIGAQLISGKYVSSTTGKIITLGEGYKPLSRYEILIKGIESKEAPVFSFLTTLLKGQDFEGNKINISKEVGQRFVGMVIQDLYDIAQDDPRLLPLGILGVFGVGLQTYEQPEAYRKLNEINNAPDPVMVWNELQATDKKLAQKVERAGIESSFTEFDWALTYMGIENGQRAQFLFEYFNSLPNDTIKAVAYKDLKNKRLLSKNVEEQLKFLFANPEYTNLNKKK